MPKRKIDFGGVEKEIRAGGGSAAHVPEGDYLLKIVSSELRTGESSGAKYYSWRLQIVRPTEYKGKTIYHTTSLKPEALWNLRNLIHAVTGKNVAGRAVSFDPETLHGKVVAATLEDHEYDGKMSSRPVDVRPKDELEQDEEDEEAEDEEVEEDEDEDLEEVDVDEL